MNWDAVGSIAELIGAVAVVGSLIYLAVQIKSGTKTLRTSTRDLTFQHLMEWNHSLLQDPDLAYIFQKGCGNFESLNDNDKARFIHAAFGFYKVFESPYLHYLDGSIGEEAWAYNQNLLYAYASEPGLRLYFSERKEMFDPRFVELIDTAPSVDMVSGRRFASLGNND